MEYTLITGASSGVGRQLAVLLSKSFRVILNGRDLEALNETKNRCEGMPLIWQCDLSKTTEIESSLGAWILDNEVSISGFVHSAGVMKMFPLRSLSVDNLDEVYSVNVFAPAMIVKTLNSKRINGKNLRSVVFISSNISNRGAASFSVYGSSKSALDGLMRNLSVELAPSVRVNSILPGGMITEMTKEIFSDDSRKKEIEKSYPLGIGTPEDIAPSVAFLLSDDAGWITGQQITVDGGRVVDITERG